MLAEALRVRALRRAIARTSIRPRQPRARRRRRVCPRAGRAAAAPSPSARSPTRCRTSPCPICRATSSCRGPAKVDAAPQMIDGRRYIELLTPVLAAVCAHPDWLAGGSRRAIRSPTARRCRNEPIGFVRDRHDVRAATRRVRGRSDRRASIVALLVMLAIGATLLLTRRLVAPMRRLMRAARAVGSGKLDVYVPASSADELGLLTHTFNHMTQRLAESQAEVATYQRTLEDKVAQRTKELEIATAHAYKLAQHDILTGLAESLAAEPAAEADPRAGTARWNARRLPVPRLRPLQADQRHARPRFRRPAAAGGRAAADHRGARVRYRRAPRRR